ncbi:hypothetical protein D9M70_615850 [compost metagenome]
MALKDRFGLEHIHGGHARATTVQGRQQSFGFKKLGARGVHQQRGRLHAGQVLQRDAACVGLTQAKMQ